MEKSRKLRSLQNGKNVAKPSRALVAKNSVVDPKLELSDPTPDIKALFKEFNARFFQGKLSSVEAEWSNRMTSSVGACVYYDRSCVVRLSAPILVLRPRKDLVETLLHEMIHAYLYVINDADDGKEHGPEFFYHMERINKLAGTNIMVDHTFHDEVEFYQKYQWRCNGPCQNQPPHFGYVRRMDNVAPGRSDAWWEEHRKKCGGKFIKLGKPKFNASIRTKRRSNIKIHSTTKGVNIHSKSNQKSKQPC